jgi:hypothetical protein
MVADGTVRSRDVHLTGICALLPCEFTPGFTLGVNSQDFGVVDVDGDRVVASFPFWGGDI